MEKFKPKKNRISQKEKAELLALDLKWCYCCKKALPLDLFSRIKNKICRKCATQKSKEQKNKNPEKVKENQRIWREANREEQREICRKRYAENPEPRKRQGLEWRNKNKDRVNARRRELYYANHAKKREWYNRWETNERQNNPLYVLSERIRKRTRYSFKHRKISKNQETQEMLGCDWERLKIHIENQFTEGMSWDRIGEIHIDHIIPLASAKTEEDLIKLAHYTNLQPLWAKDNISKGARM